MLKITEDLVLGARFRYTKSGGSLLRLFDVAGLTPGKDTLAAAASAVDASSGARIPRYGEPHPVVSGLYAIDIDAEPARGSRTAARVKVLYGSPELASVPGAVKITIVSATGRKLVNRLPDGSLIVVKYTDPAGNALQDFLQIPVLSPNMVLEFTRQESASPLKLSAKYRRTVNASPWQGGEAKTWLCRSIDAASQGGLTRYEVRYAFEYDPDGWERYEYFVDRYTGKVPDDVAISANNDKGVAKILPYGKADFSQLRLPNAY
ncbi:MAG TPA: hypothetical protein VG269_08020 [Tepidisphaeraceae bacterium]|jgi:hypothetical protein|nr:hypothetical protein [Tepidisphaeraceae bacterium]